MFLVIGYIVCVLLFIGVGIALDPLTDANDMSNEDFYIWGVLGLFWPLVGAMLIVSFSFRVLMYVSAFIGGFVSTFINKER